MIMFDDVRIETKLTCFFLPQFIAEYFAMCMKKSGIECIFGDESKVLVRRNSSITKAGRTIEIQTVPRFDMCEFLEQEGEEVNQAIIPEKYKFTNMQIGRSRRKFVDAGYDDTKYYNGANIGVIISKVNVEDLFEKSLELLIEPIDSEFKVYLEQQERELVKKEIDRMCKCKTLKDRVRVDIEKGIFMDNVQDMYYNSPQVELYSDIDMMQKLLKCDITELATFESKEIAHVFIEKIILDKIDSIVEWVNCAEVKKNNLDILSEHDQTIGKGFIKDKRSKKIKEYTTNKIHLLLELNSKNTYGFSILHARPEMRDEDIKATGHSLQSIVEQTPIYNSANSIWQVYMKYQVDLEHKNQYLVTYYEDPNGDAPNNMLLVHIPTNHPNIAHIIRIEEYGGINLYTMYEGGFDDAEYETHYDGVLEIETKYNRKNAELGFDKKIYEGLVGLKGELYDIFIKSNPDAMNYVEWLYHLVQEKMKI